MKKEIIILVTEPALIELINEVSLREKSISDLKKQLGERAFYKSISKSKYYLLKIKEDFRRYNENPIREEIEFFRWFLCKQNGRRMQHLKLSDDLICEKVSENTMFLKIKINQNQAIYEADYYPSQSDIRSDS